MNHHLRHLALGSITALAAALAGCTYSVDVRNTTSQPVFVEMIQVDPLQPDWVLASERIAPGGYAKLGPSKVPFEQVAVKVGNRPANSVDARTRIKPGLTLLDVGQKPADPARDEIIFTLERRSK